MLRADSPTRLPGKVRGIGVSLDDAALLAGMWAHIAHRVR